ncbi:MAG: hypothetical protein DCC49_05675 [Acidobacteria bacterium]|nr:MAG: hypothetical protein DCC49_05675 [Acidobacteriota bacterium]
MTLMRSRSSRRARFVAGALLLALSTVGAGLLLGKGKTSQAPTGSRTPEGAPPLIPVGDRRFRGPDGLTVEVPQHWRMDPGSSQNLWGTVRPRDSVSRLPQIGVGSVSTNGLERADAIDTVEEILNEILPELTAESAEVAGYRLTTGSGEIAGTNVKQVRMLGVVQDRVIVVWGLFDAEMQGADDLVRQVIESFDVA